MESEIKFRFYYPSQLQDAVCAQWFRLYLEKNSSQTHKYVNKYFDTSRFLLRSMGAVARVRTVNENKRIHTLKIAAGQVDGLHQRLEWNYELDAPDFDAQTFLSVIQEPCDPIDRLESVLIPVVQTKMHCIFETHFSRETFVASYRSSRVEVALDVGEIRVGERKEEICEMELELIDGQLTDLIELGQIVLDHAECNIEKISKYGRAIKILDAERSV